jgi:hypothetical protein
MLTSLHSERYRSNNLTNVRATFDAGESLPWDTVALFYHNATAAATLQVTSDDNSSNLFTGSAAYSRTQVMRLPFFGEGFVNWHTLHLAELTQTFRYIGIQVNDAANPDGHITIGIAYIGLRFTPMLQANPTGGTPFQDLSIKIRMANGEERSRRRPRKFQKPYSWEYLSEEEKEFFRDLGRTYGFSTPLIFWTEPRNQQYQHSNVVYGRLDSLEVQDREEECFAYAYGGLLFENIGKCSLSVVEV